MKLNWKTLFLLTTCCTLGLMTSVRAQITPDNSLGAESSSISPDNIQGISFDRIRGGATRGANLFHSFQEFNVNNGQLVYFSNPAGIANILTRVTGVNRSNILGTLGVLGNANLFLINPNGIFFGPNARLDLGGSFFGSTANSLIFDNGFEFSATNPQAPLLTVNIPIGLRFRDNPGNITNQSVVQDITGFPVGLQVNPGNSLALVGGNVSLEQGGSLTAAGGKIELGGLTAAGTVGLETTGNTFKLNFPANSSLSNVSLADEAQATVRSNGGGDIAVNANIFTATNGGQLVAGVEGIATRNGGDITVNSNDISFDGVSSNGFTSGIFNNVQGNATNNANAGGIDITTKTLSLFNGATINAVTFGRGNAGTVKIQASDISFDGVGRTGFSSGIFSTVQGNAVGNAGGIDITTQTLSLFNGAVVNASTFATGDAGRIKIQASDISVDGVGSTGFSSGIFSTVQENGVGNGGGIDIITQTLSLLNGAAINAITFGRGNAGSVKIEARDISVDGVGRTRFSSGIFSTVQGNAEGNAGGIDITTQTLSLTNGAVINASTFATGDAGTVKIQASDTIEASGVGSNQVTSSIRSNVQSGARGDAGGIDITTKNLSFTNGAEITASTFGTGDAGSVKIQASDISFDGVSSNGFISGIFSNVEADAVGNAGGIDITTQTLSLFNGASLTASTFNEGNASTVKIQASDISLNGVGSNGRSSGIFSSVAGTGIGNADGIDIITGKLSLFNGAQIVASTFGRGDAGIVKIQASDISFDGVGSNGRSSGIFSTVQGNAVGNGGGIDITTQTLSLFNGAVINASTFNEGNAGTVKIQASDSIKASGVGSNRVTSSIRSRVEDNATGNAGGIDITTKNLSFTNGAQITASTLGTGNAGSVKIQASDISFDGVSSNGFTSGIFSNVQGDAVGNAGGIDITTQTLFLFNGAQINAITFSMGDAGIVKIQASDISFDGVGRTGSSSGIFSTVQGNAEGDGGGIDITTGTLSLFNGAIINASTFATGDAGTVKIQANDSIKASGVGSNDVTSGIRSGVQPGATGNAGGIDITTKNLSFTNGAQITATTSGNGNAGSVKIQASDISFDGVSSNGFISGIFSNVEADAVGNAGGIDITTQTLSLFNGASLTASTFNEGNAGSVKIQASDISLNGVGSNGLSSAIFSSVAKNGRGNADGIDISTGTLSLRDGASLSASTFGQGNAGNVKIKASDISLNGVGSNGRSSAIFSSVTETGIGNAGGIDISTGTLSLFNGAVLSASTSGNGNAGNVTINASDRVSFASFGSGVFSTVENGAVGKGGNINISGGSLSLSDGALLSTATLTQAGDTVRSDAGNIQVNVSDDVSISSGGQLRSDTFGQGNAGNITIEGRNGTLPVVTLDGVGLINNVQRTSGIASSVGNDPQSGLIGNGKGGEITVRARSLSVANGAQIDASTFGQGNAGNVTINASDRVSFAGFGSNAFSSGVYSLVASGAVGNGGNINISTGSLSLSDGAVVNALTSNSGDAGNITINANTFTANGGGQVITTTRSSGSAGNINLNIRDRITISGSDPNYNQRLSQAAQFGSPDDIVNNQGAASGIFANTALNSTGKGGNITIQPRQNSRPRIAIADGGEVRVDSQGQGVGGEISIRGNSLTLDRGIISASTTSANGGNIDLTLRNFLRLQNESLIEANARGEGGGNGGNITINTPFIVAFPRNNDIIANAVSGSGGQVTTNATLFGIVPRTRADLERLGVRDLNPRNLSTSDITAFSEQNSNFGDNVLVNSPDVDPSRGLVELPETVSDPTQRIAQNPCQQGVGNEFVVTGRGGFPTNPNQTLSSDNVRVDLLQPVASTVYSRSATIKPATNPTATRVPAQGWIFNDKGQVVLTAYDPTNTASQRSWRTAAACPAR